MDFLIAASGLPGHHYCPPQTLYFRKRNHFRPTGGHSKQKACQINGRLFRKYGESNQSLIKLGGHYFSGVHIDATSTFVEAHLTVHQGVDGEVFAKSDVFARGPLGATLTADDVASHDDFRTKFFDAEAFALAVATVLDGTLSFFMSHEKISLKNDVVQ
jgi:hypothetical protein